MNKWWWFAGGLVVGVVLAPKIIGLSPVKVPQVR